jgi:O-antigen/teichoic acid export membrane protein
MSLLGKLRQKDSLMRLLRGGFVGLMIKGGAAALSLLMFAAIARVTDTAAFGVIGFCFSLATLLAVYGSVGQRMMALKDAAIAHDAGDAHALSLTAKSSMLIVVFGTFLMGILVFPAAGFGIIDLSPALIWTTIALAVALALGENVVHYFRGFRSVAFSLTPRDILWRAVVLGVCVTCGFAAIHLSALVVLWIMAISLTLLCGAQFLSDPATRHPVPFGELARAIALRVRVGVHLWGTSAIQTVSGPVLAPVILGVMISPDEVGPFFAAFRIALVLDLFTMASSMVIAPMVARGSAQGRLEDIQATLRHSVLLVSGATCLCVLVIFLFGAELLSLMNPEFATAAPALSVLALGFLVSVLCGPVPNIMELTGQERPLLRLLIWSNTLCLIAFFPMTHFGGMMGAAICAAGLRAYIHIHLLLRLRRTLGVDPSILSLRSIAK